VQQLQRLAACRGAMLQSVAAERSGARKAGIDKALGSATGEAHSGHAQLAKVVVWTSKMQHQAAGQLITCYQQVLNTGHVRN